MSAAEEIPSSTGQASQASNLKALLVIGGAVTALTLVFGYFTLRNHARFSEYQRNFAGEGNGTAVVVDPASAIKSSRRWERETLSVENCIDEALAWAEACPGVQSWCEGQLPQVLEACLASQPRDAYCREVGAEVASTRFGYQLCASRYDKLSSRYARRSRKKFCARSLRTVADHCAGLDLDSRLRAVPGGEPASSRAAAAKAG